MRACTVSTADCFQTLACRVVDLYYYLRCLVESEMHNRIPRECRHHIEKSVGGLNHQSAAAFFHHVFKRIDRHPDAGRQVAGTIDGLAGGQGVWIIAAERRSGIGIFFKARIVR